MAVILRTWKPGKLTKPTPQHKDQRRQHAALQPDCPHAINSSSCGVENSHLRRAQTSPCAPNTRGRASSSLVSGLADFVLLPSETDLKSKCCSFKNLNFWWDFCLLCPQECRHTRQKTVCDLIWARQTLSFNNYNFTSLCVCLSCSFSPLATR